MSRTRRHWFSLICAVCFCRCLSAGILWMEAGILVVNVQDVRKHPVSGVQIGVEGDGGSAVTDDHGKARIRLAPQNKEKDWVSLQIVKSPLGKDLVMVSPWDSRTPIPSFENESENFVRIVVVDSRSCGAQERFWSGRPDCQDQPRQRSQDARERGTRRRSKSEPRSGCSTVRSRPRGPGQGDSSLG